MNGGHSKSCFGMGLDVIFSLFSEKRVLEFVLSIQVLHQMYCTYKHVLLAFVVFTKN